MSFKRSVLPPVVIPFKELSESDVDVVMLDRSPEAFGKDIVQRSAFSIHADRDAVGCKNASEFRAGELAALIRIEYFRNAMLLQSLPQGFDTKAAVPVHYGGHTVHPHDLAVPVSPRVAGVVAEKQSVEGEGAQ